MSTLSVVIITLSEERHIDRCLKTVSQVADEIVVLDTFSEDRTRDTCSNYNARLIECPFPGFTEQKNFILSKASHPYILNIYANETLSEAMIQFLLDEKAKGFTKEAYGFSRIRNYCGQWIKYGNNYPGKEIRLIKKDMGSWVGQNPHDKLVLKKGCKVHFEKVNIQHFIYQHYADHLRETDQYSSIAACSLLLNNTKPSYIKPVLSPILAFIHCFFIKKGVLDGWNGYMIARITALQTFFKYCKLIELHKNTKAQADKLHHLEKTGPFF